MAGIHLIDKKLVIFYSDFEKVNRKDGLCTANNPDYVQLDHNIMIPKDRIVRIEIID